MLKTTTKKDPGIPGAVVDSRPVSGKIQSISGISSGDKKQWKAQRDRGMSVGHIRQGERAPNGQSCDNLRSKINNDSTGL